MIEEMVARANADLVLAARGRFVDVVFELDIEDDIWIVKIDKGRASVLRKSKGGVPAPSFAVRTDRASWEAFTRPMPPPGHHDILALLEGGRLDLTGDMLPLFRNLMFIKMFLDKGRATEVRS